MAKDCASVVEIENGRIRSVTSAQWQCQRCTLLNDNQFHRCQVCESPRHTRIPTVLDVEPGNDPSMAGDSAVAISRPEANCSAASKSVGAGRNKNNNNSTLSAPNGSVNHAPLTTEDLRSLGINDRQTATACEDNEWQCPSCTFRFNPSWSNRCETCGKGKTSTEKGSHLGSERQRTAGQHSISCTPKSNVSNTGPESTLHGKSWECSRCTFRNVDSAMSCSMCTYVKSIPASETWQCSQCTLENLSSDAVCNACLKPKDSGEGSAGKQPVRSLGSLSAVCSISQSQRDPYKSGQKDELRSHDGESCLVEDIRRLEEKEASELRMAIIAHCKQHGDVFVDDQFPPAPKSLHLDPKKPFCSQQIFWRRPQQIISREEMRLPWVVCRTPLPEDISQGTLGNCWFLSALAVLAEKRHLVEHLVLTDSISKEGVYQVRLCKDGLWKTVLIDDLLPCYANGELIFSKARRKQLWVPLIEKAMAKLHGSYEALVAGKCIEGLSTLTGAPCESISLQGDGSHGEETCPDVIWAKLLSFRDLKFLMGASCGGGSMRVNSEDFQQMGLRARHAYSILDVQDIEGNKLIQLRNPWGRFSWTGKWSDGSSAWQKVSKESRQRFIAMGEEHGVFWMEFEDLIRYFDSIDVCKIRPDWHEFRIKGLFPCHGLQAAQVIKLTVFQTTDVDLCLFQEGSRGESATKHPVDLCLVVLRETRYPQKVSVGSLVTHSPRQLHGCVVCSHIFSPGEYLLVPFAFGHWDSGMETSDSQQPSYVVAVHSAKKVNVCDSLFDRQNVLADTLIQLAVAKGSREQLRQGVTAYTLMSGWAGSIFVVENLLPDQAVQVKCDCTQSSNVISTRGTLETRDVVPPYHRQAIMILSHLERTQPYHVSRRLIHRTMRGYQPLADWAPHPYHQAFHFPEITPHTAPLHAPRVVIA
ncbi:calpain-d [Plakobranchus ocellatus]|uniref:Calpain-d n=1 Tax=Plakobranchus ocellatus TaxID=259542 RepID=A0AAV3Y1N1_9GAST|nr:calpain-d [Plakobranchus ocellatus]